MADESLIEQRKQELYRREQPTSSGIPSPDRTPDAVHSGPPEPPPTPRRGFKERWYGWIDRVQLRRWLLAVVVLGLAVAAVLFWRGFFLFQKDNVILFITPHERVPVGEEVTWRVDIDNKNTGSVEAGELTFHFPPTSFDPKTGEEILRETRSIPALEPRESYTEEFRGVFVAGRSKEARAVFSFRPSGSNISFEVEKVQEVSPAEFPVAVAADGPAETISGERITVSFAFENEAALVLKNLRARLEYPDGFIVSNASEELESANTVWQLGELVPGRERRLEVSGTVSGSAEEGKVFRVFLEGSIGPTTWETYKEESVMVRLAATPLEVSIDGPPQGVSPGDRLPYTVRWRNNFDTALSNVRIEASLEGEMVDLSTLRTDGSFDTRTGTLAWSQAQASPLANVRPGETGSVSFTVNVTGLYRPTGVTAPRVRVRAVASSPTRPAGLATAGVRAIAERETRIRGTLRPAAAAFYTETVSPIRNTGPYPPRVGEETAFTVRWSLTSLANPFSDVTMSAVLPPGVEWTGSTYLSGFGQIAYDANSREVVWRIGELKPNQGLFSQVPQAVFQLRVRPSPAQEEGAVPLLQRTQVTGQDSFAGVRIVETVTELDSDLGGTGGEVRP